MPTTCCHVSLPRVRTFVSANNLLEGLEPEQRGSALHWRLLVLWALFLTLAGAAITVKSLRLRETISAELEAEVGG